MAIPTPAQTLIDPNSDPALTVYGRAVPETFPAGNVTVNITNVEEVTQTTVINQTLNNAAGSTNSSVQFNINNQLVGDSGLTYDPNSDNLTVAGTVTAGLFAGSGASLTNIQGSQVVGPVSIATNASVAEFVSNANQSNITSVGTLTSLNVSGNADINAVKTNNMLYANGEPWIFDLGTGNILFAGSLLYSETNNSIILSPSYSQNASATITVPSDSDALGNNLTIINELRGVTLTTGDGSVTFDYDFNDDGSLTLPGDITSSANTITIQSATNGNAYLQLNEDGANSPATLGNDLGDVEIISAGGAWNFNSTGNLTLPGSNPTIVGGGNAGIDGGGTLNLIPDGNLGTDQYIIVDPSGPNHIHLRAGGTGDASGADLYLGAEDTFVQVSDTTGIVAVSTKDGVGNTFSYVFANTGDLNLPGSVSATGNILGARLSVSGNVDGTNLRTSGVVSATGNISGGNLSITGNINAANLIGDGSNLTNLPSQLGNFQISASTLTLNDNSLDMFVQTASANATVPTGQNVSISAANGFNAGAGGAVSITAGNSGPNGTGAGGTLTLIAGEGFVDSQAGNISISAGTSNGTGDGGSIAINAGASEDGDGGGISITAQNSNTAAGGAITISAGVSNTGSNGTITLTTAGTDSWIFTETNTLELPNSSDPIIQVANQYPILIAYGSGSHGGPELNWMDNDDPANNFSNVNTVRNTLYVNENEFYVGFNENGNATPAFAGAFTIDAADGLVTAPADMSVIGNLAAGNITTIGSGGNISGANVISANLFQGDLSALGNVEGNILVAAYLYGDGSNITNVTSTGFANGNSNIGIINNANITFSSAGNANVMIIDGAGAEVTGYFSVTGDISAANLVGPHTAGNSNIVITTNGNITFTSNSNATMVVTDTGANVAGYANATYFVGDGANITGILDNGNSNIVITANANITFTSTSNATMTITDTGANVSGYVDATYFVGDGANITGITLANLDNGNSNVVITANANVTITSSSNATMVITDTGANISGYANVTGNLSAANLVGTLASGNSNVAITANGNITLTATSNSTVIITDIGANVTGYANITGNANIGNIGTGGIVSATGNITGAKVTATVAHQLPVYADTTARDAAIAVPTTGMLVWLTSGSNVQVYTGSVWANLQPT